MKFFTLWIAFVLLTACAQSAIKAPHTERVFLCPPCAHHENHPGQDYAHAGDCPVCGMKLIEKPDFSAINRVALHPGSGNFVIDGGPSIAGRTITVFYYQPTNFDTESRVLMVIPGAGRDAWDYRDAWVEASEKYNVLILSPHYPEPDYDFAAYHMGGVIKNFKLNNLHEETQKNRFYLADEDIEFEINTNQQDWLFADFDRLFSVVKMATGSMQARYDMFGHSAGAQVLHRMVLFRAGSKVNRVIAANSGLYTLPRLDMEPLFGIKNTGLTEAQLVASFAQKLTLLLGEKDDSSETGGTMLHSPLADQQGLGRIDRGRYFFNTGQLSASVLGLEFNWNIEVVANVGHDSQRMSKAAAVYLYGKD